MSKKQEILKVAEARVRSGGYNNFSFRDIADEVGIKSASVHYHFPTKENLAAELARQYTDRFLLALGKPHELANVGKDPIAVYGAHFRSALVNDKKMCLCGMLGAESDCLPDDVRYEIKRFFERNISWLEQAHSVVNVDDKANARAKAIATVSLLEGAMMVSKSLEDNGIFDLAVDASLV
ncbi:TetR family transcriptional regulator [Pleionea sp. CnH1-48]|uniref:TetR/AcrR family transcriptional regulator n=1 Tax=Pleionea sp. CnH1-48 TaxID=2954494 RepID=UPI0020977091|nr:TetR/AcrR family transcriptional regulator [Pleionea sp. CnH1-48]